MPLEGEISLTENGDQPPYLHQVQADELKVKTQVGTLWLAMAMMVPTRLWYGFRFQSKYNT